MSKKTGARKAQPKRTRVSSKDTPPPDTKICRVCKHTRPVELMAKAGKGKHSTICRECDNARQRARWAADPEAARAKARAKRRRNLERCRAQSRARYWANPEKHRAAARERARSERGRASNRRAVEKYRRTHPQIIAAQKEAQRAVRRDELRVALVCELKGCRETEGLHLHHIDYRRPRDTIRACGRHHEHLHHRGKLELKPGAGRKWARAPEREARGSAP
jgi:hypothetical protein